MICLQTHLILHVGINQLFSQIVSVDSLYLRIGKKGKKEISSEV